MSLTLFEESKLSTVPQMLHPNDITVAKHECLTDSYQKSIIKIKEQLLNKTLNVKCTLPKNQKYIDDIIELTNKLPVLDGFKKVKPVIPIFDEIMIEEGDSHEIEKFIRKVNYDFIGFHCNHKQFDKQYNKMDAEIAKIVESNDYQAYDKIYSDYSSTIYTILKCDSYNKEYSERTVIESFKYETNKLIDIILLVNAKIITANANVSHECYKCKAAVRKYNYCVKEINRMRQNLKRKTELLADNKAEDDFSFDEFMNKNYENMDRIPLSHIKSAYKEAFNLNIKLADLQKLVEDTGRYKVTNCKHTLYANRL